MASGLALSVFAPQIHLVPLFVANATSSTSRGKSIKGRGKKCCGKALGSPFGRAGALAPERASLAKKNTQTQRYALCLSEAAYRCVFAF